MVFAGYFGVGKTLAYNLRYRQVKAVRITSLAIVETKSLLIEITEKMKRFYRNIRAIDSALQQTPEVFDAVSVNDSVNVSLRMIDHLMSVFILKVPVRAQRVRVNMRTRFNVLSA